jgi:hypothetical protein
VKFVEHVEALIAQGALDQAEAAITALRAEEGDSARVCLARAIWLMRNSHFEAAYDQFASLAQWSRDAVLRHSSFVDCASAIGRGNDYLALIPSLTNHLAPAWRAFIVAEAANLLGLDGMVVALGDRVFADASHDPLLGRFAALNRAKMLMRYWGADQALGLYHNVGVLPDGGTDPHFWSGACGLPSTLHVHPAGGAGDYFQYCRYLPLIARLGTQVIVDPRLPPLMPLMDFADIDAAADRVGDRFREPAPHDVMWTTPFVPWSIFYPLVGPLPPLRPLFDCPDDEEGAAFLAEARRTARGRPVVALFWSATQSTTYFAFRSLRLPDIAALLENDAVHWVICQRGEQLAAWQESAWAGHASMAPAHFSWRQTAGLLNAVDGLVSNDTGLLHLSASLLRPTFALLSQAACYRWERGTDTSPFYPTLRLYRQTRLGDWTDPVARVNLHLTEGFGPGA